MWDILNRVLNGGSKSNTATAPAVDPTPAADPTPVAADPATTTVDPVAAAPAPAADPITVRVPDPNFDPTTSSRQELVDTTVDGLDAAKAVATWMSKGKDRTQPVTFMLLKDCTDDHLTNILLNKPNLSADYRRVIESLLTDRGVAIPTVPPPAPMMPSIPSAVKPLKPGDTISDLNQIV